VLGSVDCEFEVDTLFASAYPLRMKQAFRALWLSTTFVLVGYGAEPRFTSFTSADVNALLPPPPEAGSVQALAEIDLVLRAQNTHTEADSARFKSENKRTPAAFRPVLGQDFTREKFPAVYELLEDVEKDSKLVTTDAKKHFARVRPKDVDSRVRPAMKSDDDYAYPSSHATRGMMWAIILTEIAPQQKKALIARGQEIGWDRVLAGLHYPSDAYAGEVLGQALAQSMFKSERFRDRLARAKEEFISKSTGTQK
jgi:acid phosphatase (class A)